MRLIVSLLSACDTRGKGELCGFVGNVREASSWFDAVGSDCAWL
jgi:hypothetical protein